MLEALAITNRLLITCIGGLAIFLGYKLFSIIPVDKNSEGRFQIPKVADVTLSRVGPGVFFCLLRSRGVGLLAGTPN
jgi:hypothetical protein